MLAPSSLRADLEPYLSLEMDESVAVVRFTEDLIDLGLALSGHASLASLLDTLGNARDVRAVLFLPGEESLSPDRCDRFIRKVGTLRRKRGPGLWIPREENAARYTVRALLRMPKPVIVALQGEVDLFALGPAMAADLRIVDADTVFLNRTRELGILPGLGLAGLLRIFLGAGTARRLLLRTRRIETAEAQDLGLVDEVVADADLEVAARGVAHELAELPPRVVRSVKRLLTLDLSKLNAYFDRECQEIASAFRDRRR